MIYRKFLSIFLVSVLLSACSDDENVDETSKPEKVGSYMLEITGPEDYTLEGNAVMGRPGGDSALAVGLEKRTSTPPGVSSSITFNIIDYDGIYKSQDIPIDIQATTPPLVTVVGAIKDEPLVGLSGTVNITDAKKEDFINANFSFTAKYGSGSEIDTVQGSGSFSAEDPNK